MEIDKKGRRARDPGGDSPVRFRLDSASGVPTYLQIVHQVEQALRLGYLLAGDRLPRVKDVVADLAINPNTVLKAYRHLEHMGRVEGRPGQGTFVVEVPAVVPLADLRSLQDGLVRWFLRAEAAGLDDDAIRGLFDAARHDARSRHGEAAS